MDTALRFCKFLPAIVIAISVITPAQAGSNAKYRYIKTALPAQQKDVFIQMGEPQQKKIQAVVDQHSQEAQEPAPAVVMEKINEDEIPKIAITEYRDSTITDTTTGLSQATTLKIVDGVVVAIIDKNGWEATQASGNAITSASTGATYTYTRGKLRRRTKRRHKTSRLSFKRCMKNKACRKSYKRLAKRLKKNRYIPTHLRAKRCMKKKACRNAVKRIIRRYNKKHCYIPTRGRKVCKVKR